MCETKTEKKKRIKWDINKVRHFVEVESNSGCKLMSEVYLNNKTEMNFKCRCGEEFKETFKVFQLRSLCEKCRGSIRWNYQKIKNHIEEDSGSGSKLLSKGSMNSHSYLKIRCSCGKIYERQFYTLYHNKAYLCKQCSRQSLYDNNSFHFEDVKDYIENESKSGCVLLSKEYINANRPLLIKCTCGNNFEKRFSVFKRGQTQCPSCGYLQAKKKREEEEYKRVKNFIEIESGSGCILLSKTYKGNKKDLEIICKCGETYCTGFNAFYTQNKRQCNGCGYTITGNKTRKTQEEFNKEVEPYNNEYNFLENYKGATQKIKVRHLSCGFIYTTRPNDFLSGYRCPKCNESKGERAISEFLNSRLLKYKIQKKFDRCRYKNRLPFDVAINKDILLEYDGEQHFYPVDFAGKGMEWASKNYLNRKHRDKIKNQYCIDSNIPLLRIPYWEFDNIEIILESALMHFNIIERGKAYDTTKFIHYIVNEDWDHDEYIAQCPKNKKESQMGNTN